MATALPGVRSLSYPPVMDPRPTLAAPDDDPHLWLEAVDGPDATAWADAQTRATHARLAGPGLDADTATLCTLLDRPDNLPVPNRRGGLLYNFWRDAAHPRGLWRRTTLQSYATDAPDWDILLDLDALAAAEAEDWVWAGSATLPPDHARALLRLSRGGSDAVVLREFDLRTRTFVAHGFDLPEQKGGAAWLDEDTLLLSTALRDATTSGYPGTTRLWHRGTAWDAQAPIFRTDPANMSVSGDIDRDTGHLLFMERTGFFDVTVHIGDRTGPTHRVPLPTDAWFVWHRGWVAVRGRTAWTAGPTTYPADTVVTIALDALLAGSHGFRTLFTPTPRQAVQGFFWADDRLIVSILDELRPTYLAFTPGDWTPHPLPACPPPAPSAPGRSTSRSWNPTAPCSPRPRTPSPRPASCCSPRPRRRPSCAACPLPSTRPASLSPGMRPSPSTASASPTPRPGPPP